MRKRSRRREPVRLAVVGLGYWGPNLVRNAVELPAAEVVAVCDTRAGALAKMRKRHPGVAGRMKYDRILADRRVEAIVLATPVATHFELASQAIRAGKHVFVEKPLASSSVEAVELIELARANEVVLMAGHTFLYSPPVNLIRDLIAAGDVGDLHFVTMSRVNLGRHPEDVSVVWDLGSHDISILRYWLGETPAYVTAVTRALALPATADVAFVNLEFASGCIAHIHLSRLAPSKLRRTTVVGSRQMVVYDDRDQEPVRIFNSGALPAEPKTFGEFQLTYRTGDTVSPRIDAVEPLRLEMEDFCRAVRRRAVPRSSAEIGLEVIRVIEAIDRSLARGGARERVDGTLAAADTAELPALVRASSANGDVADGDDTPAFVDALLRRGA